MKWYIMALKRYTDFTGRSRRSEYWWFVVFSLLFNIVFRVTDYFLGWNMTSAYGGGWLTWLYGLAMIIPSLAINVRRLHDIGKSGWYYVLFFGSAFVLCIGYFIYLFSRLFGTGLSMEDMQSGEIDPTAYTSVFDGTFALVTFLILLVILVMVIWYLVLMFRDSAPGTNKWGPNPKEVPAEEVVT